MFSRLFFLAILSLPVLSASGVNADAEFFESKVRPILQESCYKCHSHSSDKIKGGLVVDSRDALLTGGDSGAAVVPGDLEKSLLITAIRYEDEDLQMPPKGKKLTDEQIAILTDWVKRGAPWPGDSQKMTTRPKGKITDEDREWWAFKPVVDPVIPKVDGDQWSRNEVDRFILARLEKEGLSPTPAADKGTLLRRVTFTLTGLPPTLEESRAFQADDSPDAFSRVVDRLLASPRYGEHWARHWLDLVRYAESDGFRIDDYRPDAWRYRDYVVKSFNDDKPYDRFVREQLAGDEIAPGDPEARVATTFLRHWLYEYNNSDAPAQWSNILNDLTDVTADVFLGMGVQCARCHDHKFDPILQKDYFRLQAFFAPLLPRDDLKIASEAEIQAFRDKHAAWEAKTADLRHQIAAVEAPHREKAVKAAMMRFPRETQALINKPAAERTPFEHQVAELGYRQVDYKLERFVNNLNGPDKDKLVALNKQLAAFDAEKPASLPPAFCATDVGSVAPPVFIPKKQQLGEIAPGFLTVLQAEPAAVTAPGAGTTGRRKALADWFADPKNPLTTRVVVNRIWQYHFGRGLAESSSDFGKLGASPSHPELLDYLTARFIEGGWSWKQMHRAILLSATWQQSVHNVHAQAAALKDPENRLLWRGNTRRLSAEQIRDAVLATTGELNAESGGPSVDWAVPKRTIYTKVIRNTRDPLLEVFDAPDGLQSTAQRNTTTTPTQSLLMINSPWSLQRAKAFAARIEKDAPSSDEEAMISGAFQLAYGREPKAAERDGALRFMLQQGGLVAARPAESKPVPFVDEKIPFRDGRGASLVPGSPQEKFAVAASPAFPREDFTMEAFVVLRSLYEDAAVRTIASQWDGNKGHPGWSLGVTSKGSRYKAQTLVLQLSGDQAFSDKDPVEPIFSGLHIELGKPYYIGVSVDLDDATEKGITFYAKDLSNDDEPIQIARVKHKTVSGIRSDAPFVIGGRGTASTHLFDGLIDDVRIANVALPVDRLLLATEGVQEHTTGYWRFDADPGVYKDSAKRSGDIVAKSVEVPKVDPRRAALVDFCQVLLNSNEFLYID